VLIDPIPVWKKAVPELVLEERYGHGSTQDQTIQDYYDWVGRDLRAISSIRSTAFERFEVAQHFCNPVCQKTDESGVPIYYDSNHLNLRGARVLTPVFEKIFTN
jgi:hypothetical protein